MCVFVGICVRVCALYETPHSVSLLTAGDDASVLQTILQNQQLFMNELMDETEAIKQKYIGKLRAELLMLMQHGHSGGPSLAHSINLADDE